MTLWPITCGVRSRTVLSFSYMAQIREFSPTLRTSGQLLVCSRPTIGCHFLRSPTPFPKTCRAAFCYSPTLEDINNENRYKARQAELRRSLEHSSELYLYTSIPKHNSKIRIIELRGVTMSMSTARCIWSIWKASTLLLSRGSVKLMKHYHTHGIVKH